MFRGWEWRGAGGRNGCTQAGGAPFWQLSPLATANADRHRIGEASQSAA